jgi:hypothetical protein
LTADVKESLVFEVVEAGEFNGKAVGRRVLLGVAGFAPREAG